MESVNGFSRRALNAYRQMVFDTICACKRFIVAGRDYPVPLMHHETMYWCAQRRGGWIRLVTDRESLIEFGVGCGGLISGNKVELRLLTDRRRIRKRFCCGDGRRWYQFDSFFAVHRKGLRVSVGDVAGLRRNLPRSAVDKDWNVLYARSMRCRIDEGLVADVRTREYELACLNLPTTNILF